MQTLLILTDEPFACGIASARPRALRRVEPKRDIPFIHMRHRDCARQHTVDSSVRSRDDTGGDASSPLCWMATINILEFNPFHILRMYFLMVDSLILINHVVV